MASMIRKRRSEAMDDRVDPAQFGFRKIQVHITAYTHIQNITRNPRRSGVGICNGTFGLGKTFDKIHQGRLLDALKRIGVPLKMVRVIEAIYKYI